MRTLFIILIRRTVREIRVVRKGSLKEREVGRSEILSEQSEHRTDRTVHFGRTVRTPNSPNTKNFEKIRTGRTVRTPTVRTLVDPDCNAVTALIHVLLELIEALT